MDVLIIILVVGGLAIIFAAVGIFIWKKYKKKKALEQLHEKALTASNSGGAAPKIGDNQVASSYSPPPVYDHMEDEY